MARDIPQPHEELVGLAFLDDLTGGYNRRFFYKFLSEELRRSKTVAVFMIDIDDFKKINDKFGHLEGDALLVSFFNILKKTIGAEGTVARYAGDEFTIALPGKETKDAVRIADNVLKAISSNPLQGRDGKRSHHVTISLGVAVYPYDALKIDDLIDRADQALYSSKKMGRNRISTADQIMREAVLMNKSIKMLSSPTFVDRAAELSKLKGAISVQADKKMKAVLVSGQKGAGKTRLMEEFLAYARSQKILTLKAKGRDADLNKPYGMLTECMCDYLTSIGQAGVNRVLSKIEAGELKQLYKLVPALKTIASVEIKDTAPDLAKGRVSLFRSIVRVFESIAGAGLCILAVDDIQWMDEASLNVMRYFLNTGKSKLFILAVYYEGREGEAELHRILPFKEFLSKPENMALFSEMKLGLLDEASTTELLSIVLAGSKIPRDFAQIIYRNTKGNPLFIEEQVKFLCDKGLVSFDKGEVVIFDIKAGEMPVSFDETEKKRFEKLDGDMREVLIEAAFLGNDFNLDVLKKISGKNEGYLGDIIESANKLGFTESKEPSNPDRISFVNSMIRDVLAGLAGGARAKELHKKIASTIEGQPMDELTKESLLMMHYGRAMEDAKAKEHGQKLSAMSDEFFSADEGLKYLDAVTTLQAEVSIDEVFEAPLNKKNRALVPEMVSALRAAIEVSFLYPADSEARLRVLDEAYNKISGILETDRSITLSEVEGMLLINGEELWRKGLRDTLGTTFAELLTTFRISSVTFKSGFKKEELRFLLDSMRKAGDNPAGPEVLSSMLKERGMLSIKVDQVRYEKAHKLVSSLKRVKGVLQDFVERYPALQGLMAAGQPGKKDPVDIKKVTMAFSQAVKDVAGSPKEIGEKSDIILKALREAAELSMGLGAGDRERFRSSIADIFSSLDPALRSAVIGRDFSVAGPKGAVAGDVMHLLTDEEKVKAVTYGVDKEKLSGEALKDMIRAVLLSARHKDALVSMLDTTLLGKGLTKEQVEYLTDLREEAAAPQGAASPGSIGEQMRKSAAAGSTDKTVRKRMSPIIEELIMENKDAAIEAVILKMLAELGASSADRRRIILGEISEIMDALILKERDASLERSAKAVLAASNKEDDLDNYSFIADMAVNIIRELFINKKFPLGKDIADTFRAQPVAREPVQEKLILRAFEDLMEGSLKDSFLDELKKSVPPKNNNISGAVIALGEYGISSMITLIEEREKAASDPFELFVRRRRICAFLRNFGRTGTEMLEKRLSREDPKILRNVIEALGYMGDRVSAKSLAPLAKHPSAAVKEEVIRTLRKLWCPDSLNIAVSLLRDRDMVVSFRAKALLEDTATEDDIKDLKKHLSDAEIGDKIREVVDYIRKRVTRSSPGK